MTFRKSSRAGLLALALGLLLGLFLSAGAFDTSYAQTPAGPGAAPAVGLEMVKERADQRRIELPEIEPRWLDARSACR